MSVKAPREPLCVGDENAIRPLCALGGHVQFAAERASPARAWARGANMGGVAGVCQGADMRLVVSVSGVGGCD
jgi:hypothetical protein